MDHKSIKLVKFISVVELYRESSAERYVAKLSEPRPASAVRLVSVRDVPPSLAGMVTARLIEGVYEAIGACESSVVRLLTPESNGYRARVVYLSCWEPEVTS